MAQQENRITKEEIEKLIDERSKKIVKKFMSGGEGFTARKITDTPTDALSIVNRKFVTLNGSVASRPTASVAVIGQHYFASDTLIPMVYSTAGWRNGVGSIVAQA